MKALRDIEKRYKILFYLAIIVIYFLFLDNFYDLGSKATPVKPGFAMKFVTPGIGEYLRTFTGYFSWFLIAVLGYFSRSKFDGMMMGLIIWVPWVIHPLMHPEYYRGFSAGMGLNAGVAEFIQNLLFTLIGALIGIVFGFIGSKRKNKAI